MFKNLFSRRLFSSTPLPKGKALLDSNNLSRDFDTVVVGFTDLYGRLLGKRYSLDYFLKSGIKESKACTYTFAIDMDMNPLEGFKFANWSSGFGDFALKPDVESLRVCGWLDRTLIVLCDVYDPLTNEMIDISPRTFLKKALNRIQKTFENDVSVLAATELEYYLYTTSYEDCHKYGYVIGQSPNQVKPAGYYSEDYHILQGTRNEDFTGTVRRALAKTGMQVETSKGETGIGQHELNTSYDEVLAMADNHVYFKQCLKEVAMQQGKSVTFMAKPVHGDAGSSCHIHLSLHASDTGRNLFYKDPSESSDPSHSLQGLENTSTVFKHFLGGWMHCLPDFFPMYCPTINSYKRLQKGSWAPTSATFGIDNRTSGFRVIKDHNMSRSTGPMRIECRIPGADVNPYLVLGASILSGAYGLENAVNPPPMLQGDGYSQAQTLPMTLKDSTKVFGDSGIVKDLVGEDVQEHYRHFYHLENESFESFVTDFERKRYFEQI